MPRELYQPLGGNEMPRFSGPGTFMRLPSKPSAEGLDACFVGIGLDIGTSNRSGARYGPRQIRAESSFIRPYNMGTRAAPFDSLSVADIGDVAINTFHLPKTVDIIERAYDEILQYDVRPITLGGDHTLTQPVLRAFRKKYGPVAFIHMDAHADVNEAMFGEKINHGSHVRRSFEEGSIVGSATMQIGLRGTGYSAEDFDWGRDQGFRVVQAEECWWKSLTPLAEEAQRIVGDRPLYLSIDIDVLDPGHAPGTGTPEVAGLTGIQVVEFIRGLRGLNLVGADVVEVSPPYDPSGNTALTAANLLFEILCVLPGVVYR